MPSAAPTAPPEGGIGSGHKAEAGSPVQPLNEGTITFHEVEGPVPAWARGDAPSALASQAAIGWADSDDLPAALQNQPRSPSPSLSARPAATPRPQDAPPAVGAARTHDTTAMSPSFDVTPPAHTPRGAQRAPRDRREQAPDSDARGDPAPGRPAEQEPDGAAAEAVSPSPLNADQKSDREQGVQAARSDPSQAGGQAEPTGHVLPADPGAVDVWDGEGGGNPEVWSAKRLEYMDGIRRAANARAANSLRAETGMDEENQLRHALDKGLAEEVVPELGWSRPLCDVVDLAADGRLNIAGDGTYRNLGANGGSGRRVKAERVRLLLNAGFLRLPDGGEADRAVRPTAEGDQALYLARLYPDGLYADDSAAYEARLKAARIRGRGKQDARDIAERLPRMDKAAMRSVEDRPQPLPEAEHAAAVFGEITAEFHDLENAAERLWGHAAPTGFLAEINRHLGTAEIALAEDRAWAAESISAARTQALRLEDAAGKKPHGAHTARLARQLVAAADLYLRHWQASPNGPEAHEGSPSRGAAVDVSTDDTREYLTSADGRLRFTLLRIPSEGVDPERIARWKSYRDELAAVVAAKNEQSSYSPAQAAEHLAEWRSSHKTHTELQPFKPLPPLKLRKQATGPGYVPKPFTLGSWVTWRDEATGLPVTGQVMSRADKDSTWYVSTDRTGVTGEYHVLSRSKTSDGEYAYSINGATADVRPVDGPGEQVPFEDLPVVAAIEHPPLASYAAYVPAPGLAMVREPIPLAVGDSEVRWEELVFDVHVDGIPFIVNVDRHPRSGAQIYDIRVEADGVVLANFGWQESRGAAIDTCVRRARVIRERANEPLLVHQRVHDFHFEGDGVCGGCANRGDPRLNPLYRVDDREPRCLTHAAQSLKVEENSLAERARANRIMAARIVPEPQPGSSPAEPGANNSRPGQEPHAPAAAATDAQAVDEPRDVARDTVHPGDLITIAVHGDRLEWSENWGTRPDTVTVTGTVYPGYRDYHTRACLLDAIVHDQDGTQVLTGEDVWTQHVPNQVRLERSGHRGDLLPEPRTVARIRIADLIAEGGRRGEVVQEVRYAHNPQGVTSFHTRDAATGDGNDFTLNNGHQVLVVPRERRDPGEVAKEFGQHGGHAQVAAETERTHDLYAALDDAARRQWPDGDGPQEELQALQEAIAAIDPAGRGSDAYRANAAAMTVAAAAATALFDAAPETALYSGYVGEPLHTLRQHLDVQIHRLQADITHLTERDKRRAAAPRPSSQVSEGLDEHAPEETHASPGSETPTATAVEFPGVLLPEESVTRYVEDRATERPDYVFTGAHGHEYRVTESAPDEWKIARLPWSPSTNNDQYVWWSGDGPRDLDRALAWMRHDGESRAKSAGRWERHRHRLEQPVPFSTTLETENLEPHTVLVKRFGRAGLLTEYPWGWEDRMSGAVPETLRKSPDNRFEAQAWSATHAGLDAVPSERLRVIAVDQEHDEACAVSTPFVGKCKKDEPHRFVVDVLGEDGTSTGHVVICGKHLTNRLTGGDGSSFAREAPHIAYYLSERKGTWTDWQDRAFELSGELLVAALDAGQVNPWPDVRADLYQEALELGACLSNRQPACRS
jgi:hypothetical protein